MILSLHAVNTSLFGGLFMVLFPSEHLGAFVIIASGTGGPPPYGNDNNLFDSKEPKGAS